MQRLESSCGDLLPCELIPYVKFCLRSRIRPHPALAGPVMIEKSGIRAARCLSRRRVCADPRFSQAAQVARSEAKGHRLRVAFSFGYFYFGEAKEK